VIWPIVSYGASTGLAPIQVKIRNRMLRDQNINFFVMSYFVLITFLVLNGKITMMRIEATKAITPPNLFGMERRMA